MKLRNQLLALFCLLVFIALGVLYFRTWAVQKPFGIILFIGDGLVTGNLTAAKLYEGGADHRLTIETMRNVALVSNHANDFAVPDTAAAASALATGVKVNNGSIAINPHGKALAGILELARERGRATGVVTTGGLADAGVAAFYAHAAKSNETENIAAQFADSAQLDVAFGGGAHDFTPESKGGHRKDGRDLLLEMKQKGREVLRSKAELENASAFSTASRIGIFANGDLPYSNQIESGSQQPSLPDMTRRAIQFLQTNGGGYFLVLDAALISRAAEQNDGEHVLTETVEFDHAIATAIKYAGEKSLVIAVGKHATGGMTLNGYPLRQEHGVGLLGVNAFGYPAIAWASGPNNTQTPAASPSPSPQPNVKNEPAAFFAPAAVNSAEDVIAVGIGPGSEAIHGFMDNTTIFQILKGNL
jgi:alkaline phosphatase